MNGNHLEKQGISVNNENLTELSSNYSQPNKYQNIIFEQIMFGIFILTGGLAYLFDLPAGTLFTTAGTLMLIICARQIISRSLSLNWLCLLIGFLCLSKGISTLFSFEITFIPILFCLLGIYIISKAIQDRNA